MRVTHTFILFSKHLSSIGLGPINRVESDVLAGLKEFSLLKII